jgi:hypothetical protein
MNNRGTSDSLLSALVVAASAMGCGGASKLPSPASLPRPETPSACVPVAGQAEVSVATADGKQVQFCMKTGAAPACFAVDLATGKYSRLDKAPRQQPTDRMTPTARIESTATRVTVCRIPIFSNKPVKHLNRR